MTRILAALASVVFVLGACDASVDPPGGRDFISFGATVQDTIVVEKVEIRGDARQFHVTGYFVTSSRCMNLDSKWDTDERDLRLTVTATPNNAPTCTGVVGHFRYVAVGGYFNPGTYNLRVVHKDGAGTRTIHDGSAVIAF